MNRRWPGEVPKPRGILWFSGKKESMGPEGLKDHSQNLEHASWQRKGSHTKGVEDKGNFLRFCELSEDLPKCQEKSLRNVSRGERRSDLHFFTSVALVSKMHFIKP